MSTPSQSPRPRHPRYWEIDNLGQAVHDPDPQVNPGRAGPGRQVPMIEVTPDDEIRVVGHSGEFQFVMNRGAARWLGVRLIEAAAIQEVGAYAPQPISGGDVKAEIIRTLQIRGYAEDTAEQIADAVIARFSDFGWMVGR